MKNPQEIGIWLGISVLVVEEKHKRIIRWGDGLIGEWRKREERWKWISFDEARMPTEVKTFVASYHPESI